MYKSFSLYSVHYPAYSLNVASMYLKLGRLYLGLEKTTQGVKALKKVHLLIFTILIGGKVNIKHTVDMKLSRNEL